MYEQQKTYVQNKFINLLKSFCDVHSITHLVSFAELKQLNLCDAVVILSNHLTLLFAVIIFGKKPNSPSSSLTI